VQAKEKRSGGRGKAEGGHKKGMEKESKVLIRTTGFRSRRIGGRNTEGRGGETGAQACGRKTIDRNSQVKKNQREGGVILQVTNQPFQAVKGGDTRAGRGRQGPPPSLEERD